MDLRVLPEGPVYRISQALGEGSRGCRLDPAQIETLSIDVEVRIPGSDLLVVNKFGKQECLGRGLRPAILRALDHGLPVVVGVNGLNERDFLDFAGGRAVKLPADPPRVVAWVCKALSDGRPAAVA
jgi:hypothetical protein